MSQLPSLLILVGAQGSGKSTFSESLLRTERFVRISQDELGSRGHCETLIGKRQTRGQCIILDRCNFTAADRRSWLAMWGGDINDAVAVYFDYPEKVLKARVSARRNHPTIPFGGGAGAVAIDHHFYCKPLIIPYDRLILCCLKWSHQK